MERKSFARAWRFLSYKPTAKWLALSAAAASGFFYLAFLIVLGLAADLIVHRGQIPTFRDLTPYERDVFLNIWSALPISERQQHLEEMDVPSEEAQKLASMDAAQLDSKAKETIWRSQVYRIVKDRVGLDAAQLVKPTATEQELTDRGVLSLIVRSHYKRDLGARLYGPALGTLARIFPWMWRWQDPINANSFYYLSGLVITAVVLAFLRAVVLYVLHASAAQAVVEASTRLRRAVYHHTHRLGRLAFRSLGPAEAVGIFTKQLEILQNGLYVWLTVMVREPIKFILLLVFALLINFWLALAFLFFALLIWVIGGQMVVYIRRQERQAARDAADQLALLQESLMMTRLVKVYLMELFNQARVERQLSRYAEAQKKAYRGEEIYRPLLVLLGTLSAIALLYLAGLIVLSGRFGVASAITMSAALVSLYWPTVNFLEHRRVLRRAREAASIVFRFLDRPGEVGQAVGAEFLPPMSKSLEFDDVTLHEPGTGRKLIESVSLRIEAGQRIGIVGTDELQKHALVYLIPRFLDPTLGEVRIDNKNIRWVTLDSLRSQISMVMQHNLVFNDTVANNIGCGDPQYDRPKIIEAAKLARAHHFIQKLPRGYETVIGEAGHTLNVGQQFRIALARAIVRDPRHPDYRRTHRPAGR
ncbi:MAG: hypothetical protein KatS3mg105_1687 [Gemmatales bacterium]|nr:MAG: hypothetical protein KatS3mg105_1687 [Gemmatales bacterium]